MGLGHLGADAAVAECQFEGRAHVLGGARVVDGGLVAAGGGHVDVPRHPVVGARPVREERAVGRLGASLDAAVRHAVAGRQQRDGPLAVPHGERPVVLAEFAQHLFLPAFDGLRQPAGHVGVVLGDVAVLAGVGHHVIQMSRCVEAMLLRADARSAAPITEDEAVGPVAGLAHEQRTQADAVERLGAGAVDARQVGQRGQQVDGAGNLRHEGARLDVPRPADEARRPDAALVGRAFPALHAGVPPPAVRAIVAEVDDDGVVGQAEVVEAVEQASDVPIDVLAHGQGGAGMGHVLLLRVAVPHAEFRAVELLEEPVGHLHRAVRGVVRQVAEERPGAVGLDERQRVVRQVVDDKALAAHQFPVVLQFRAEVVAPVARAEAVVLVESAGVGMVRPLEAVVPLAEGGGGVAGGLERFGNRGFVQVEAFAARRGAVDAAADVVPAGQEFGPRGRTDRADEEAVQACPAAGQRVETRRGKVRVAVDAQVAPALVVGDDEEDVGPASGRRVGGRDRPARQKCRPRGRGARGRPPQKLTPVTCHIARPF